MLENLSDEELMLKASEDDVNAFEILFKRYSKAIYSYLARMTGNIPIAEDFTQEVFLRLWKNREKYKQTGKFSSYLYQIAHNYFLNEALRKKLKTSPLSVEEADSFVKTFQKIETPLEILETKELYEIFEKVLLELTDTQREVFILCRFHKMKYKEIAEILEIPLRTVESRLLTATQKIMNKISYYLKNIGQ